MLREFKGKGREAALVFAHAHAVEPHRGSGHDPLEIDKHPPAARGRGTGRQLLNAAVDRARALGACSLFLGSNRRLTTAVGLYESAGFHHVPRERVGPLPYARADVFMELPLARTFDDFAQVSRESVR